MTMQRSTRVVVLAVLIAATASCGDVARQGRSPVFLVIDRLEAARGGRTTGEFVGTLFSDVITNVITPEPCAATNPCPTVFGDSGRVTLRIVPKDIGSLPTAPLPTSNNEVTITRYRVVYKRTDGRNTQGVDVPYSFDSAVTGTVPAGGTLSLAFLLVRVVAKQEAPLVQLQVSPTFLDTIAELSFYGQDRVGNEISVTGSILIEFGNFGD
jgi:hypothetical protein